jgi:hypothetical protein
MPPLILRKPKILLETAIFEITKPIAKKIPLKIDGMILLLLLVYSSSSDFVALGEGDFLKHPLIADPAANDEITVPIVIVVDVGRYLLTESNDVLR